MKLTERQLNSFENQIFTKRHWSTKKDHLVKVINNMLKSYNIDHQVTHDTLENFITIIEKERALSDQERYEKFRSGEYQSPQVTPTKNATYAFSTVSEPVIGQKYHLSWAYKGAIFVLVEIDGNTIYLDNPKYRRKKLLKAKLSDLRHTRNNTIRENLKLMSNEK